MTIIKKLLPHAVAVVLFALATVVYFSPMTLGGKQLPQGDIKQSNGASQEIINHRKDTKGEEALWTNSMFGGMPAYQISVEYHNNWLRHLSPILSLKIPSPAYMIFIAMLGFYIMLLCFKVNPWLAIVGALAYGLSTYFMHIAGAGHNTKMRAMAYMPPIIGGLFLAYARRRIWLGVLVVCLSLGLQIRSNHLQITYYTGIIVLIFILFELVRIIKEKQYNNFVKTSAAMLIAVVLAVGVNITNMLLTAEYAPYSTRGQSELTDNPDDRTKGLDRSYILGGYSYGLSETFNLFIPSFAGGPIAPDAARKSPFCEALVKGGYPRNDAANITRHMTYWGGQENGTAGPVYLGAVMVFLFVLGLFVVKGQVKWWLLTATLLSIMLAWGRHFELLSNLFIDVFPMYNKFRTVSMILTIAMLTVPLLGILAVNEILSNRLTVADKRKALRITTLIVGGIALFFALIPSLFFDFKADSDPHLHQSLIDALRDTRESVLREDALRSFLLVVIAAAVLWYFLKEKLKPVSAIALLGILIVIDLWTVDKRYLNNDSFVKSKDVNTAQSTPADLAIRRDTTSYRVLNLTVSPFNDATTSFFHQSIGGYHGAKMKRYQELIERRLSTEINSISSNLESVKTEEDLLNIFKNSPAINMLNTKYVIVDPRQPPIPNLDAPGNAWPVSQIQWADNADAEIAALATLNPAVEAVIDKRYQPALEGFVARHDSTAAITLIDYKPNHLVYEYHAQQPQLVVFSEIFYDKGWNAYIDGNPATHIRADYVLRAMAIPEGDHRIIFKFEPVRYALGEKIALASSIGIILLILGIVATEVMNEMRRIKYEAQRTAM